MSLDVYLDGPLVSRTCQCTECGNRHETKPVTYWGANITHNLARMAAEAGIYGIVWHPEDNGITHANNLIVPLDAGIARLKADRKRFEAFNDPDGWGLYEHFVPWLERYLAVCREYPDATVRASR